MYLMREFNTKCANANIITATYVKLKTVGFASEIYLYINPVFFHVKP